MRSRKSSPLPQRTEKVSFESGLAMLVWTHCYGVGFWKSTPGQNSPIKMNRTAWVTHALFLLASGLNDFCVYVSVYSLLPASISSTAGSGLWFFGCIYNTPWHGIKRRSLGVDFTWSAAVLGLFIYLTFTNDVACISSRSQAWPSNTLTAGGPCAHNTSWLLLYNFNLAPPGRKPLWAHCWCA